MKPIIIAISIGILLQLLATQLKAQTVLFQYDNGGNRISRTVEEEGGGLKSLARSDSTELEEEIIEEEMINGETRIFPNPTHGVIKIDFYPDDEEPYYLSVNNLSGYQLINQRIFEGKNELDISKYPPGTYVITIYSEEKRSKWIILKI